MIHYIKSDATKPIGDGTKIICHVCNDIGAWGAGFVLAISKRWKKPELYYRQWSKEKGLKLGQVQIVPVGNGIIVANMIAQHGIYKSNGNIPLRYSSLRKCLASLQQVSSNSTIHMPRIGCGLAGGDWNTVEKIIKEELPDHEIYVYDLK